MLQGARDLYNRASAFFTIAALSSNVDISDNSYFEHTADNSRVGLEHSMSFFICRKHSRARPQILICTGFFTGKQEGTKSKMKRHCHS